MSYVSGLERRLLFFDCLALKMEALRSIKPSVQTTGHEMFPTERWGYMVRCGGELAVGGPTGPLLVGAIECSATTNGLKTSVISSNVY